MLEEIVQGLREIGMNEIQIGSELFWRGYELNECQNDEQLIGWRSARVRERKLLEDERKARGIR